MGNCFAVKIDNAQINNLWIFLTNNNTRNSVYFMNSRGIEKYEIKKQDKQLIIVDLFKHFSYNLSVKTLTLTDCVLVGTYTYNNKMIKRAFAFKLVDNFVYNRNTYGWRTKVTVSEGKEIVDQLALY